MENKSRLKKSLGFALVFVFGLIFLGCDDMTSNNSLVNVRVINETGRAISNVRFIGSDGSIHPVEEIERNPMGNRGQGRCWISQDGTYALAWECPIGGPMYAQMGGFCGGRYNAQQFSFRNGQQRTIVLRANNTWAFVNK